MYTYVLFSSSNCGAAPLATPLGPMELLKEQLPLCGEGRKYLIVMQEAGRMDLGAWVGSDRVVPEESSQGCVLYNKHKGIE